MGRKYSSKWVEVITLLEYGIPLTIAKWLVEEENYLEKAAQWVRDNDPPYNDPPYDEVMEQKKAEKKAAAEAKKKASILKKLIKINNDILMAKRKEGTNFCGPLRDSLLEIAKKGEY